MAAGRLFISYRRDDSKYAAKLIHERLVARFGRGRVFIDVAGLEGGIDYFKAIHEMVAACDVCVALVGEKWGTLTDASGARRLDNPNDLLRIEIATALASEDTAVIPCLLDAAELPPEAALPGDLRPLESRQIVRIMYPSFDRDILALIRAIREAFARATRRRRQLRLERWRNRFLAPVAGFASHKPVRAAALSVLFCAVVGAGIYEFGTRPVFAARMLLQAPPQEISKVSMPTRGSSYAWEGDWRDEVLYYILVDRFSDGREGKRRMLNPADATSARGDAFNAEAWLQSGRSRWQGGTLAGIRSKLDYLKQLGVSALVLSPLAKQRGDSYLGYSPQNFVDVDPHFGTRRDLVNLIADAHRNGMRVILSAVLVRTGRNWDYPSALNSSPLGPAYNAAGYPFGNWLDGDSKAIRNVTNPDDGVWPREFQDPDVYYRQGLSGFGGADQLRRGDFPGQRHLRFSKIVQPMAACYRYWIALTDCDGLYLNSLDEVPIEDAYAFVHQVKSYAETLGKKHFLIWGQVFSNEGAQAQYLARLGGDLGAVLDLQGQSLRQVAAAFTPPSQYFQNFSSESPMASYRYEGKRTVLMLDFGDTRRPSAGVRDPNLIVAATAFQLFTPGIPCLYYGDEQSFGVDFPLPSPTAGSAPSREAMFGPDHPRKPGKAGLAAGDAGLDLSLPGFGPFGSSGWHGFNPNHPVYRRIAALTSVRRRYVALSQGGLGALRQIAPDGGLQFREPSLGGLVAWTRSAGTKTVLCIVNLNATQPASAAVSLDPASNETGSMLTVVANTMHAAEGRAYKGTHPVTSRLPVQVNQSGVKFVTISNLNPYEVLVLAGNPVEEDTDFGQVAIQYQQNPNGYGSATYYQSRKRR
jgi:glycosidase